LDAVSKQNLSTDFDNVLWLVVRWEVCGNYGDSARYRSPCASSAGVFGFGSRLLRLRRPLDHREKLVVAERSGDALGGTT